ncbi:Acylpyruvase fahd1, mitochondrial [Clydaea vesicula]|uniref:Acylpyruvase fahd1, mitochondrial n=1 Tax=Clydaea vesicula TaxID=447962 RepID=A0AAD5U1H1_9FUNG|nr:Acylpyruvase fahd1, mitochondrial [Clydaea vesicula]KAJ3390491.1 Acylpyruvase fahd1, mitochondrial [Lobulomyces angularis]
MSNFTKTGKKIIAIGRNYVEHAKELGNAVPSKPFFFLKPTTSYLESGNNIEIPKDSVVHHEVELGVVIGKNGRNIPESEAMSYVEGYCLALDMTARNLQDEAKKKGHPWSISKGFDTFTPVSKFIPKDLIRDPNDVTLWLKVNQIMTQNGSTSDMLFKIPTLINFVSSIMKLEEGDVILTGTPKGVGPIFPGQVVKGGLKLNNHADNIVEFEFGVVEKSNGLFGKKI